MKNFFVLLFSFLIGYSCNAQLLKRIGKKIESDAEWRIRNKADQQINKGLGSLIEAPKKINKKTAEKENTPGSSDNTGKNNQVSNKDTGSPRNTAIAAKVDDNNMTPKDGFITLKLSAGKVFTHGSIVISGESVKYKNYNEVEIKVTGPSVTDVRKIPLSNDGKYLAEWIASEKTGDYTVTVKGSDKKASQSASFSVEDMELIFDDEWPADNIRLTNKALAKLEEAVGMVEPGLGSKDKAELDKKLSEIKDKVKDVLKLYKDLNTAGKQITQLAKSGKKLSPNLYGNLTELNNTLNDHAKKLKQIEEYNDHKPAGNTICEYLVMVNEACAAFSTFTNVYSKSIATIIVNIGLDKGAPKVTSMVNERYKVLSEPNDFALKEPAKIFSTAALDAESLTAKLGTAGFAGDMIQFATDFLMKKYCGVYKGSFTHEYTLNSRNSKGETWYSYGFKVKAALSLRYPNEKSKSSIIKMKGNLEGNATNFSFFEDIDKEDGFHEGSKGEIQVFPIKSFIPLHVSFATSERDILGFGAIARGLATPAYFNIPIDAEYDVDANKIKIFINEAIIDFSDLIANQFVFLLVGGDLIPYIKKMNFPISKARLTINSVVKDHNEFTIEKDAKGNLSFSGKGHKHIGSPTDEREHDLNFTISAKKE